MQQKKAKRDDPAPPQTWEDKFHGQSAGGSSAIDMLEFILQNTKTEEKQAHEDERQAQHDYEDSMTSLKKEESDTQAACGATGRRCTPGAGLAPPSQPRSSHASWDRGCPAQGVTDFVGQLSTRPRPHADPPGGWCRLLRVPSNFVQPHLALRAEGLRLGDVAPRWLFRHTSGDPSGSRALHKRGVRPRRLRMDERRSARSLCIVARGASNM